MTPPPWPILLLPEPTCLRAPTALQRRQPLTQPDSCPPCTVCAVVCLAAPAIQWLLILHLGHGYLGAAVAASAYNVAYLFFQLPHLTYIGYGSHFSPRAEAVRWPGLRDYLRLMLPGRSVACFLMACLVWSA